MFRSILGVLLGYLAMAGTTFVGLTAGYFALGADGAFQPGTYDVTATWLVIMAVVSVAAALLGGWFCARLSRGGMAPKVLAGLVLVLGLISAFVTIRRPDPGPRTPGTTNLEAAAKAKQPAVVTWSLPLVGAVGVILGARRRGGTNA